MLPYTLASFTPYSQTRPYMKVLMSGTNQEYQLSRNLTMVAVITPMPSLPTIQGVSLYLNTSLPKLKGSRHLLTHYRTKDLSQLSPYLIMFMTRWQAGYQPDQGTVQL